MQLFTYSEILAKAQLEMDLTQETFITATELLGYMNEAIDNAETAIHNLGAEDCYFLASTTMSLVSGQQEYSLPSDIYANKLRKVHYNNGSLKYEITKLRRLNDTLYVQPGENYRFIIFNNTIETGGVKLRMYPTPTESGPYVPIYYIRNMRRLTSSTTDPNNVCEIPDAAVNFIHAHLKWNVMLKSRRPDLAQAAKEHRDEQYELMMNTLKEMVPDENNLVQMDVSAYFDQETDLLY